jgi:hypothetical protein
MIAIKPEEQGSLRSYEHTKKGENIPLSELMAAKHSKSKKTRAKANFAINARKWK